MWTKNRTTTTPTAHITPFSTMNISNVGRSFACDNSHTKLFKIGPNLANPYIPNMDIYILPVDFTPHISVNMLNIFIAISRNAFLSKLYLNAKNRVNVPEIFISSYSQYTDFHPFSWLYIAYVYAKMCSINEADQNSFVPK